MTEERVFIDTPKEEIKKKHGALYAEINSLPPDVKEKIDELYTIINRNPLTLIVPDVELTQTIEKEIELEAKGEDGKEKLKWQIRKNDVILDCIPTEIIEHRPPPLTETTSSIVKYTMTFLKGAGKTLEDSTFKIEQKSIEQIAKALRNKGGVVLADRRVEEVLNALVSAFERAERLIINKDIETSGFYLVENKIIASKIPTDKIVTSEDALDCVALIEEFFNEYPKQTDKAIISLTFKWFIVSPLGFTFKQLGKKWIPDSFTFGEPNTAKTFFGTVGLSIWQLDSDQKHLIAGSQIDSVYKFGKEISETTMPKVVDEVGFLNNVDKTTHQVIEMWKTKVESIKGRSKMEQGEHVEKPALTPLYCTSNHRPPEDAALHKRVLITNPITQYEKDVGEANELWFEKNKKRLAPLGYFVTNYILTHQEIVKNPEVDWESLAKLIITEFYKLAGKEAPEWLSLTVKQDSFQELSEAKKETMRSLIIDYINKKYALHVSKNYSEHSLLIAERIHTLIELEQIPFMSYGKNNKTMLYITRSITDIFKEANMRNIPDLPQLAKDMEMEYEPSGYIPGLKKNGAHIRGHVDKFLEFLKPALGQELETE